MRKTFWTSAGAVAAMLVFGCGDNSEIPAEPDAAAPVCTPPATALPASGPLRALEDYGLPADCVAGGLRDMPGRWFAADLTQAFSFSYPRFAGDCATGFRNAAAPPDDLDDSDGRAFQTWSDGTRFLQRSYFRFGSGPNVFEFARGTAACMKPDGTLAMVSARYDSDNGASFSTMTTERFGLLDGPATGLVRVGGLASFGAEETPIEGLNVWVDGGVAYVAGLGGLDVVDVSDPANPVHRSRLVGDGGDGFNDVRVVRGGGRVIAFASPVQADRTAVIDVTDPANPIRLTDISEYSHSVQLQTVGARTFLYLATYTNAIPVYDVTVPAQPIRVGAPVVPGDEHGIHDLFVDGTTIFANNTTGGMSAIDVSAGFDQPAVGRGQIPTTYSHASWAATIGGRKIVIHGDEGMTPTGGAFMRVLDGDPASPTFLRELSRWSTRPQVGIHNMEIVGTRAYIAHYQDGVRIVELADPTRPREVAHYNTWDPETAPGSSFEGAVGFRPGAGGLSYVADLGQGLIILRETP